MNFHFHISNKKKKKYQKISLYQKTHNVLKKSHDSLKDSIKSYQERIHVYENELSLWKQKYGEYERNMSDKINIITHNTETISRLEKELALKHNINLNLQREILSLRNELSVNYSNQIEVEMRSIDINEVHQPIIDTQRKPIASRRMQPSRRG